MQRKSPFILSLVAALSLGAIKPVHYDPKMYGPRGRRGSGPRPTPRPRTQRTKHHKLPRARAGIRRRKSRLRR